MKDAHALNLILTKIMNLNQARPDDIKYCPFIFSEIHEPSASIRNGPAPVRGPDAYGHVQGMYQSGFYRVRELFLLIVSHEYNKYSYTTLFVITSCQNQRAINATDLKHLQSVYRYECLIVSCRNFVARHNGASPARVASPWGNITVTKPRTAATTGSWPFFHTASPEES